MKGGTTIMMRSVPQPNNEMHAESKLIDNGLQPIESDQLTIWEGRQARSNS